ncbi:MAG: magnesium transporter CorA family protein [Parcubacteria group bacterium]|nr:magnesium transporter CorA family protein [Parcubacteria group bacterium]
MFKKHTYDSLTWIDLESPTKDDTRALIEEFGIHSLVADELLSPTLRSRVETHGDYIFLILHFPTVMHSHGGRTEQEIDFIVGKHFIVTAHYEPVDALDEFSKLFEINSVIGANAGKMHAGFLFFHMARELYKQASDELDHMRKELTRIEESIFRGEEHAMVQSLSRIGRKLLTFKRAVRPHREVLESFASVGAKLFGKEFAYYLHAITGEQYKIFSALESDIDTLDALRATNDSLLSTKTNDIMRVLTIMAFVTFPLVLVTSVFGMNTAYLPVVGLPNDFWIIVGFMVAATIGFFLFFKSKKWL